MRLDTFALSLCLTLATPSITLAKDNPFDAVFAIMTQPSVDSNTGQRTTGCRGCHIREDGPLFPYTYFGDTQDQVAQELRTHAGGELIDREDR